jgi:hypothetical protein
MIYEKCAIIYSTVEEHLPFLWLGKYISNTERKNNETSRPNSDFQNLKT